jgi:glycosyltransferase involved in cell wall biosynthesis
MLIGIDASRLITTRQPTGVETYCRAIISGLVKSVGGERLILYTPELIAGLPRTRQKILRWPLGKLWSQLRLGGELLFSPPNVFFSPGYVIPFLALLNKTIKKIVTIHDVAFVRLPASYSFAQRYFLKLTTRQAVKHADKIIVPTRATKHDLINYFNCPPDKIEVTYFGYKPRPVNIRPALTRKKQILYLGRLEDKKNIPQLIRAFKIFYQTHPAYRLILAGKPGIGFKGIQPLIARYKFIDYRGYVPAAEKQELLQNSTALVLLSKYEGFGFPLLEAFSYQLPVLASDIPVLREVGQSACLFAHPDNPSEIAKKLESIIINKELRQQLILAGQQRLKQFDWEACVKKTRRILNV